MTLSGSDGSSSGSFDSNIYYFDSGDFDFAEWDASLSLEVDHAYGTAFLIDDKAYDCS